VPVRAKNPDEPLQLQICSLDYSSYVARSASAASARARQADAGSAVLHGKIHPLKAKINQI